MRSLLRLPRWARRVRSVPIWRHLPGIAWKLVPAAALAGLPALGVVWAVWHAIPFVQTDNPAGWVAWQSLKTIGMRVLIVWIYRNTGRSVFAAILYHAADNVCWSLFPNLGSHYDPLVTGAITWLAVPVILFSRQKRS